MGEVRQALGETAKAPQWIVTVQRRGYRFLSPVTCAAPSEAAPPAQPAPPLVGREAVLTRLHTALTQARRGMRQVLFLTGEPGMGKTAVAEAFAASVSMDPTVWLVSGQCIEHYGLGEPYLPILEALGQLCRGPGGTRLGALLRQQAPTWLVQMPWLLTPADRHLLQQELHGTTRERMLREFAEVLETLTAETPLVLVLEDLHWSDHATLDLLTLLARRRAPARLLLLGTFRPVDTLVRGHPLRTVAEDLQRHGHGTALPLDPLNAEAVTAYLNARFPGHAFPAALAPWLHQHTDGNPLFLVTMVSALVERGLLAPHEGHWTLQETLDAAGLGIPEGVRPLLEQQIERLPAAMQQVLEVASVAGVSFAAAAVAAGLETPAAHFETRCEVLARYHVLQAGGLTHWPDGTITTHYTFTHALYQQAAYERLGAGRRAWLHQRLGARLEAAYGSQAHDIAAELAEHFVRGQDTARAVQYLQQAGENAMRRCAHQEAIAHLTIGLSLLTTLPETPEHARQELGFQTALGSALMATKGWGAPEVAQVYARARTLSQQVGESPELFPVRWGLWRFYFVRAQYQTARELAEQCLSLAHRGPDSAHVLLAHHALGSVAYYVGEVPTGRAHLEQGLALYEPQAHRPLAARYGLDLGVWCLSYVAWPLWLLGYPDQALHRSQAALALAQELAHPLSLAAAWYYTALLHHLRREGAAAQACAEAAIALAHERGFPLYVALATNVGGWALAVQGHAAEGLAQMRQGQAALQAMGAALYWPCYLAWLAEAYARTGQVTTGLHALDEALRVADTTGEQWSTAELYRLRGDLLLAQSAPPVAEAEACLRRALAVARQQQTKSWELRAAVRLGRLWQQQGKRAEARELLAPLYGWFTEGFDTADLHEAKALLEELEG